MSDTGNRFFRFTTAAQFVEAVDMMRDWGYSWAQIDTAFDVNYQRSRRVYKSCCATLGILDKHHYQSSRSYIPKHIA